VYVYYGCYRFIGFMVAAVTTLIGVFTAAGLTVAAPELGIRSKRWWVATIIIIVGAEAARHMSHEPPANDGGEVEARS
jgi:hypothetical protein